MSLAHGSQAALAFKAFCHMYLQPSHDYQAGSPANVNTRQDLGAVARGYVARIQDASPSVRQGCALALGALPPWLLWPEASTVISSLAHAIQVNMIKMASIEQNPRRIQNAATAVTPMTLCSFDAKSHTGM